MSKKGFSKLMIAIGILIMIIGMNMSVSRGGSVVNLQLLSQRQNLIMLGGFVFLGGIIFFGVARIKQTPEDEATEVAEAIERKKAADELSKEITKQVEESASSFWKIISNHFTTPQDMRLSRLATSVMAGLALSIPAEYLSSVGAILVFGGVVWAAYRNIPASKALRPLLGITMIVYAVIMIVMAVVLKYSTPTTIEALVEIENAINSGELPIVFLVQEIGPLLALLIMPLLIFVISAYFYFRIGKAAGRATMMPGIAEIKQEEQPPPVQAACPTQKTINEKASDRISITEKGILFTLAIFTLFAFFYVERWVGLGLMLILWVYVKLRTDRLRELERQITKKPFGRNDLCPCGSGNRFKHCCGKLG